jgi:hypothetical protein
MLQQIEDWWDQRAEFRKQTLIALRKREGLPTPELIDGKMQYRQQDESYSTMAVGARKQESETVIDERGIPRTVPTAEVAAAWDRGGASEFEILEVAEDGRRLVDELVDLHRDSATYERAEKVSHGREGEQAPDLVLDGTGDDEVDARLQEYLKRGPR